VLLAVYAVFTMACVATCTASVRQALDNAELSEPMLTASSLVAVAATVMLAAVATCAAVCVSWVLTIGGVSRREELAAVGLVLFLVLATAAATVSSWRGLIAARTVTSP
jgi:hypothetical protein